MVEIVTVTKPQLGMRNAIQLRVLTRSGLYNSNDFKQHVKKSVYNCSMEFFLTDIGIDTLIKEEKRVSRSTTDLGRKLKEKKGHKEFDLKVDRPDHSAFKVIIR